LACTFTGVCRFSDGTLTEEDADASASGSCFESDTGETLVTGIGVVSWMMGFPFESTVTTATGCDRFFCWDADV
jgi:hypothetical protein